MAKNNQLLSMSGISLAVALVLGVPFAEARTPSDLSDLERGNWDRVSSELRSRGWTFIDSHWDERLGGTYGYWWHASDGRCVQTETTGNTVRHIDITSRTDCNQFESNHEDRDEDHSGEAAVAIGAAALLGIAALAHKSHHRDDDHNDRESTADFERGYRDGLHHYGYDYENSNDAYQDGYSKGRDEREHRGRHRDDRRPSSGYGPSRINVQDLIGTPSRFVGDELRRRGFNDVGGEQADGAAFTTWWNPRTRQCIETVTRNAEIVRVNENVDARGCR